MTTSSDQKPKESGQGEQALLHQKLQQHQSEHPPVPSAEQLSLMDPRQPNSYVSSAINQSVPQLGSNTLSSSLSADKQLDSSMASATADQHQHSTSTEIKNSIGDNSSLIPTTGDAMVQDAQKSVNSAAANAATSDLLRGSGPRGEGLRSGKEGYERRIGRGTSWRRDHEALDEEDYTVRGRGRGAPPGRGRGYYNNYRDFDSSREYPYHRDFDRRPPPAPPPTSGYHRHSHPLDSRGPPYPPPDPYYESRGTYSPPPMAFDTRRDYPPESARYSDDYRRRGYDPRDVPPPLAGPPSPPLPAQPQGLDSRRSYERGPIPGGREDPSGYGRSYSRLRDPRDEYRGTDPRDPDHRLPPDPRISRDTRPDPRYIDEGRPPRRMDEPRMLPHSAGPRRPRDPTMDYRDEENNDSRPTSLDRSYSRVVSREVDSIKNSPILQTKSEDSTIIETKHKEMVDPGRDTLNNGATIVGSTTARSGRPESKLEDHVSSYGYDRDRLGPAPTPPSGHPPSERYREPGDYGRAPYSTFEGRGGGPRDSNPRDLRDSPAYEKSRDPRDPYYSADYPTIPHSSGYRGRGAYPPRATQSPLDYERGPPPPAAGTYDERYPRGMPMDLEPPSRGREGYRDLPPRQHEFGPKRKFSDSGYSDPYYDDFRPRDPRYSDRPLDFPRPPYEYDDREPKRMRGPPPEARDPGYGRPPYDDHGPPRPSDYDRPHPHPGTTHEYDFRRIRPHGRYFLVKTSTAENIAKSRETGLWGVQVKDVEILREAFKNGDVTFIFALDESGRFLGYAEMASEVGSVSPMPWMEEHCSPIGAAFKVEHRTTDDVRTLTTIKSRNFMTEGKPIRFGQDGQEISPKEGAIVVDELEKMSGPENAEKRAQPVVPRGGPRGRGRGGRGSGTLGYNPNYSYYHDNPRGRGRGRG